MELRMYSRRKDRDTGLSAGGEIDLKRGTGRSCPGDGGNIGKLAEL